MRKTRVRRRFRKRSATPRKTRKNIHKSKKHINSRRRVMRGGTMKIDKLTPFKPNTILIGFGLLQLGKRKEIFTSILYNIPDKIYYYLNKKSDTTKSLNEYGENEKVVIIKSNTDGFSSSTKFRSITNFFYDKNIEYRTMDLSIDSDVIDITIKDLLFKTFSLPHNDVRDKTVVFANFNNRLNAMEFIFKDETGNFHTNSYTPMEDTGDSEFFPIQKIEVPVYIELITSRLQQY